MIGSIMGSAFTVSPEATIYIEGESLFDGQVESAELMGGAFDIDLDGVMSPIAANVFVLRALGRTMPEVGRALYRGKSTTKFHYVKATGAMGVQSMPAAIHRAFSLGLFEVTKQAKPLSPLNEHERFILERTVRGENMVDIARLRGRALTTIKSHNVGLRRKLGDVGNLCAAITMGHLTGELSPDTDLPILPVLTLAKLFERDMKDDTQPGVNPTLVSRLIEQIA